MYKILFALLLLSFFTLNACHNSVRDLDNSTQATFDFAQSENLINDVWKQVHWVAAADSVLNNLPNSPISTCADTIYRVPDKGPYPITLTIDYGSDPTTCSDGRVRSGKIIAVFSGQYFNSNSEITISTENYKVDDIAVFTMFNLTMTDTINDRLNFVKKVDTAVFSSGSQQLSKRSFYKGDNTVEMSGYNTAIADDDMFTQSGAMQGVSTTGNSYDVIITFPIVYNMNCNWEMLGDFTQVIPNLTTRKGSFGSGSNVCDNKVSVIINNKEYQVRIP